MYKRMLVPLDGSKLAEIAISYARHLAVRMKGMEVVLLHVYHPHEKSRVPMHKAYIKHAADTVRHQIEEGAVVKVRGELLAGSPADKIVPYVDKHNINLILMATHGYSGVNRWAMGSVAYKVMRSVKVPVLLIRAGITEEMISEKMRGGTILVPLDGTKRAESVLPHVQELVKQFGDDEMEVVLLRVCEPPDIPSDYPYSMPVSWEEHVEQERVKCKLVAGVYLTEIGKELKKAGLKVRTELSLGKPADEKIITYANENNSSFIIMATHGRSGISRWAYGSVAEKVMLGTFIPVILVGHH